MICISLIQEFPNKMLYCVISFLITCNIVYIVLYLTVIGNKIDPIIKHKASLNAFCCSDGT